MSLIKLVGLLFSLQLCLIESNGFEVYWNAPSNMCRQYGINIDISQYHISQNHNDDFNGNRITLFYETKKKRQLGLYPYIAEDGTHVNGGLPLRADLEKHLKKANDDLHNTIPTSHHDNGLAVIDWESWVPVFEQNTLYIRQVAQDMIREDYPHKPAHKVYRYSRWRFQKAARKFMLKTLKAVNKQRHKRTWGFYGVPRCPAYDLNTRKCFQRVKNRNSQLKWLVSHTGALFPAAYFPSSRSPEQNRAFVHIQVAEAQRLARISRRPNKPIYLYGTFGYRESMRDKNHPLQLYSKENLASFFQHSAAMGVDGVIIWGSSNFFNSEERCRKVYGYVHSVLGPYVRKIVQQYTAFPLTRAIRSTSYETFTQSNLTSEDIAEVYTMPTAYNITEKSDIGTSDLERSTYGEIETSTVSLEASTPSRQKLVTSKKTEGTTEQLTKSPTRGRIETSTVSLDTTEAETTETDAPTPSTTDMDFDETTEPEEDEFSLHPEDTAPPDEFMSTTPIESTTEEMTKEASYSITESLFSTSSDRQTESSTVKILFDTSTSGETAETSTVKGMFDLTSRFDASSPVQTEAEASTSQMSTPTEKETIETSTYVETGQGDITTVEKVESSTIHDLFDETSHVVYTSSEHDTSVFGRFTTDSSDVTAKSPGTNVLDKLILGLIIAVVCLFLLLVILFVKFCLY